MSSLRVCVSQGSDLRSFSSKIDGRSQEEKFKRYLGVEGREDERFDIPWAPSFQLSGRGSDAEVEGSSQASGLKLTREEDEGVMKPEALY